LFLGLFTYTSHTAKMFNDELWKKWKALFTYTNIFDKLYTSHTAKMFNDELWKKWKALFTYTNISDKL